MSDALTSLLQPAAATVSPAQSAVNDAIANQTALSEWIADFEMAEREKENERTAAERYRDYYDGNQFTADEIRTMRDRGQPPIVVNYVVRKIDLLRGMERRARTDPKAQPRTPHEDTKADAATQSVRYVADDNIFDVICSDVYDNIMIEGFGGAEVIVEMAGDDIRVRIIYVSWDRLFYDPRSRARDFSDTRFRGTVIWMDRQDALDQYPDAGPILDATSSASSDFGTFEDKPRVAWSDTGRTRCRIVQMYRKQAGVWWMATFTKGGFLSPPETVPYLDREGKPDNPLIMQSAKVDRELDRYGVVREMIPLQDEINKRRSKAMHYMSVRQLLIEEGAVDDVDATRREYAKPDGVIIARPTMTGGPGVTVLQTSDLAAGQVQMLQHATSEMQATGPNASMAGNDPRDQSGRAILAQQNGGAVQNEALADALRQWKHRIYEAVWMRIRQYWTAPKWLRVTDDSKSNQWVGLNQPVTLEQALAEMPPDQANQAAQQMGLQAGDPRLQQVVRTDNVIGELDVDITIEEGPDVPTMQQEQFQQLMQFAGSMPGVIPPEVLIEASTFRNKDKLLDMMEKAKAAQAQAAQAAAPIQQANAQADIAVKHATAADKQASAAEKQAGAAQRVHAIATDHANPMVPTPTTPSAALGQNALMPQAMPVEMPPG